jgi:uncharacterized membrane protein YagU involved in acid resistance
MSGVASPTADGQSLVSLPSHPVGYLAVLAALVSAGIHLLLAPRVVGFSQTLAVLFVLNGLGFLGGIAIYLTRYWRRELYLVAALYGVVTIVAFFVMSGQFNAMSVTSKVAEGVFVVAVAYLYRASESR